MVLCQYFVHRDKFVIQLYFLSTYFVLFASNHNAFKQRDNNNGRFNMLVAY
jgi:hypothetical protein